jgi:hypothetical protein
MRLKKPQLRTAYMDIVKGYSPALSEKFGSFYIKHIDYECTEDLDEVKEKLFKKATKEGLPDAKQREKDIIEEGFWSKEKDEKIKKSKEFLSRLKETKAKVLLQKEIDSINEDIKKTEKELEELVLEKLELIGYTAEVYTAKKVNEYYLRTTSFKDKDLKTKLLSDEEFDYLQDPDVADLTKAFGKYSERFEEENIKRISLCPYFLNFFSLSEDNPMVFYGKPVVELTFNQVDLFSYGRYFKNMIQNMKRPLTESELDDPDKIIDLFNSGQNADKITNKTQKKEGEGKATSIVGATKDDMERMGITPDEIKDPGISLHAEAAKKGGNLSMDDLIKLHGA